MRPSGESAIASKPLEPGRFLGVRAGTDCRGEKTLGSGTGASRTRPLASVWTMNGPNGSPNQSVPSGVRRTDSMSKSPPVRIRSSVFSLTIGNGTLPSGSLSVTASRTCTVPRSHRGFTR